MTAASHSRSDTRHGIAVDLGTTRIRVSLWDRTNSRRLARISLPNPQFVFGTDVLSRLTKATESPKTAKRIALLARQAIGRGIQELLSGNPGTAKTITNISIVGNTAMLLLLAGKEPAPLLQPIHWKHAIDCTPKETQGWLKEWGLEPTTAVSVIPPLAGFIGSDLIAALLSTRLAETKRKALLIDFGTNSEIALWDGKTMWVTSAAGGPAFEGCGISCGMPAQTGAIYKVESIDGSPEFRWEVLGNGVPKGICGSGLVDVVANLVKGSKINPTGRFVASENKESFVLSNGKEQILLMKQDVDALQRAKSAIGAGIQCLVMKARTSLEEIDRVCICGAFGEYLNIGNAQAIGLLPELAESGEFELRGDAALEGCELLLEANTGHADMNSLIAASQVVNMAGMPEFEDMFVRNLYLKPIGNR